MVTRKTKARSRHPEPASKVVAAVLFTTGAVVTGIAALARFQRVARRKLHLSLTGHTDDHDEDVARMEGEGGTSTLAPELAKAVKP
jgi:hypothetical protein